MLQALFDLLLGANYFNKRPFVTAELLEVSFRSVYKKARSNLSRLWSYFCSLMLCEIVAALKKFKKKSQAEASDAQM